MSLSEQIRTIAYKKHIEPAVLAGEREFSIAVRDLMNEAESIGIQTRQRTPPFCTAIQKQEFLREHGLEIVTVDGPAKKQSTRVVVHYRRTEPTTKGIPESLLNESPKDRAFRLTERLRGLMKEEISSHGGTLGYIRWVRSSPGVRK